MKWHSKKTAQERNDEKAHNKNGWRLFLSSSPLHSSNDEPKNRFTNECKSRIMTEAWKKDLENILIHLVARVRTLLHWQIPIRFDIVRVILFCCYCPLGWPWRSMICCTTIIKNKHWTVSKCHDRRVLHKRDNSSIIAHLHGCSVGLIGFVSPTNRPHRS